MDRIYYIIGRIVQKTQELEKNLELVVKYSEIVGESERNPNFSARDFKIAVESAEYLEKKMETMTLGQRIHIICETRCFSRVEADELKKTLEKRNYFAHEYFKYTPFEDFSESDFNDEVKALKAFFDSVVVINKKICVYKNSYSDKYNKLAKVFGGKGV